GGTEGRCGLRHAQWSSGESAAKTTVASAKTNVTGSVARRFIECTSRRVTGGGATAFPSVRSAVGSVNGAGESVDVVLQSRRDNTRLSVVSRRNDAHGGHVKAGQRSHATAGFHKPRRGGGR